MALAQHFDARRIHFRIVLKHHRIITRARSRTLASTVARSPSKRMPRTGRSRRRYPYTRIAVSNRPANQRLLPAGPARGFAPRYAGRGRHPGPWRRWFRKSVSPAAHFARGLLPREYAEKRIVRPPGICCQPLNPGLGSSLGVEAIPVGHIEHTKGQRTKCGQSGMLHCIRSS
jgi:hypothetical protein